MYQRTIPSEGKDRLSRASSSRYAPPLCNVTAETHRLEVFYLIKNSMRQTEKKIVHRAQYDNHLVEVIDRGDERFLIFAGNIVQSSMSIKKPERLTLSYTRYMMAALLANSNPEKVLIVGLGAGSLLRFINYHLPGCLIDGIDNAADIINLCRRYFHLPDKPEITIHCCDGYDFLAGLPAEHRYDLILVDAFDTQGMATTVYRSEFFALCCEHLTRNGIISLNLWSGNRGRLDEVREDISSWFSTTLELPVPKRGNVICLGRNNQSIWSMLKKNRSDLETLSEKFSINFRTITNICLKNNLGFFQRLSHRFNKSDWNH